MSCIESMNLTLGTGDADCSIRTDQPAIMQKKRHSNAPVNGTRTDESVITEKV